MEKLRSRLILDNRTEASMKQFSVILMDVLHDLDKEDLQGRGPIYIVQDEYRLSFVENEKSYRALFYKRGE